MRKTLFGALILRARGQLGHRCIRRISHRRCLRLLCRPLLVHRLQLHFLRNLFSRQVCYILPEVMVMCCDVNVTYCLFNYRSGRPIEERIGQSVSGVAREIHGSCSCISSNRNASPSASTYSCASAPGSDNIPTTFVQRHSQTRKRGLTFLQGKFRSCQLSWILTGSAWAWYSFNTICAPVSFTNFHTEGTFKC